MAVSFLSGINLNQNQLIGARIENVATDPISGVLGQIIFNTTSFILKVCTSGSPTAAVFSPIGSAGSTYTLPVSAGAANTAEIKLTDNSNTVTSTVTFIGGTNIAVSESPVQNGSITIGLNPSITITGTMTAGTGQHSFGGQVTIPATPSAATDAASKGYVDNLVAGGVVWQGGYDALNNSPNLDTVPIATTINKGFMWTVTQDGQFFGEQVRIGDSLIANQNAPTLLTQWTKVQSNIDIATSSTLGLVKIINDTAQSVAANTPGAVAGRTYGVQFNGSQQLVVNVPWTDTIGRVEQATTTNSGGSGAFLGIDIPNPASGTVVVGLSINGLTDIAADIAGIDTIPIYDASVTTNKKVSVTNLAARVNALTTFSNTGPAAAGISYTISAATHGLGTNAKLILVQLLLESTGETVFADVTRDGISGLISITFAASQASNTIRALLQKIA